MVMVFSASANLGAPPITHQITLNPSFRHAIYTVAGLIVLLAMGLMPYEWWRIRPGGKFQPTVLLMGVAIVLLVAVLFVGEQKKGATRWLSLGGGLSFQPSEVAKLAVVVFFAAACSQYRERLRRFWTGLLPLLLLLGTVVALIGYDDFGTAVLILIVGGCILLAAGARIWHLGLLSGPAVAGLAYLVISKPHRIERIMSFLDPEADPQGSGYQGIQSLITIASGGWWGRGLGQGIQKYDYLPEGRSDFIFAVICEELGAVGGVAVILLFALLVWHGRKAILSAATDFGRLLALGATLTIGFQAALNIAVVTVSVPTKGIGLPLVSAGGTSVLFLSFLIGMLANVARARPPQAFLWHRRLGGENTGETPVPQTPAASSVPEPRQPLSSAPAASETG
jgi:cell division protein FtsW